MAVCIRIRIFPYYSRWKTVSEKSSIVQIHSIHKTAGKKVPGGSTTSVHPLNTLLSHKAMGEDLGMTTDTDNDNMMKVVWITFILLFNGCAVISY